MNIDPLDGAAGLTGIEEGAVHQILNRVIEVGIGTDIGWVLAAELQPERDEAPTGGLADGAPAGDRAGEGDEIDLRTGDEGLRCQVIEVKILENASRQPGGTERLVEAFGCQWRLMRVLEDDRIAGEDCRHHRVDRRQQRIVPRRHHQDDA